MQVRGVKYKLGEKVGIRVNVPRALIQQIETESIHNKSVYIVLDKSGSMAAVFTEVKRAVIEFIKQLRNAKISNINVVFYDSESYVTFTQDMTLVDIEREFGSVNAGGGTNFMEVFMMISSVVDSAPHNHVAVVFFTDGQDNFDNTPGKEMIQQSSTMMMNALSRHGMASEVHALGFTAEHDAALLARVATMGTTPGTFQYIRESDRAQGIRKAIENITELAIEKKLASSVMTALGNTHKLALNRSESNHSGMVFFSEHEADAGDMLLNLGASGIYPIMLTTADSKSEAEFVAKMIQSEIHELTNKIASKPPRAVLNELKAKADQYDAMLSEAIKKCFRLSRQLRKSVMEECMELKEVLSKFYELLAAALANNLTNDKLATFTSFSYRSKITKRSLAKKLDKVASRNASRFEKAEQYIEEAVKKIDFDALERETPEDVLRNLTCVLSTKDFIEALEDHDCMCIAMRVSRPEAAIADPTQIVIQDVTQSFISADSFLDSVKFTIGSSIGAGADPSKAHGGFNRNQATSLVKGIARDDISGCLPLYINEQHWSVAREKMKPLFGWMATLDVLGYTFSQVKAIPYLVLTKVIEQGADGSEFKAKQAALILDVCQRIYRDSPTIFSNTTAAPVPSTSSNTNAAVATAEGQDSPTMEVKQLVVRYIEDPLFRTSDIVPNTFVFLANVLCAVREGHIIIKPDAEVNETNETNSDDSQEQQQQQREAASGAVQLTKSMLGKLMKYVAEEEIRRSMNHPALHNNGNGSSSKTALLESENAETLLALLGVDVDRFVTQPAQSYATAYRNYLKQTKGSRTMSQYSHTIRAELGIHLTAERRNDGATNSENNVPDMEAFMKANVPVYSSDAVNVKSQARRFTKQVMSHVNRSLHLILQFRRLIENATASKIGDATIDAPLLVEDYKAPIAPVTDARTLFALLLQNYFQRKNAHRREAVQRKQYADPFVKGNDSVIFERYFTKLTSDERSRAVNDFIKDEIAMYSTTASTSFAMCSDVYEAAGILKLDTMYQGGPTFTMAIRQLQMPNIPLALEKIEMMVTGQFRGVPLIVDKMKTKKKVTDAVAWVPSRKNLFRMWCAHKDVIPRSEWERLFPSFMQYLEKRYVLLGR